jgi:hypothetical protein
VQAFALAKAALDAADTDRLRVASLTLLGRCEHARGRMEAANQHYAQVWVCALRAGAARGRCARPGRGGVCVDGRAVHGAAVGLCVCGGGGLCAPDGSVAAAPHPRVFAALGR